MHQRHFRIAVRKLYHVLFVLVAIFVSNSTVAQEKSGPSGSVKAELVLRHVEDGEKFESKLAREHAKRRALAKISETAFGRDGLQEKLKLQLNLFPDLNIVTTRRHLDIRAEDNYSWFGRIDKDPNGAVIITRIGDLTAAYVAHAGRTYWVLPLANGTHEVMQLNDTSFPNDGDTETEDPIKSGPTGVVGSLSGYFEKFDMPGAGIEVVRKLIDANERHYDDRYDLQENGSVIDVLIFYTPAAGQKAFGHYCPFFSPNAPSLNCTSPPPEKELVWLRAQLGFDVAKSSFILSGINTSLRVLTWPIKVNYAVGARRASTVTRELAEIGDGELDSVHIDRDAFAADIVVLLTDDVLYNEENRKICGRVQGIRKRAPPVNTPQVDIDKFEAEQAANAFTVISIDCVATLTTAHEIGHLLGARHDRYVVTPKPEFERDGFGYILEMDNEAVRTIMSYSDECDFIVQDSGQEYPCPQVTRWSNPDDFSQFGEPLGIPDGFADSADNRRVLNNNRVPVSRYRWWGCRIVDCN